ncbi:Tyrosine-protein phosphatase 2 [Nakaseomyces bracarensis]|uniref:Tyrosine-protein phosphatase 2 n=1 Tax=Nakaseomyces bracarensis TaxID=273131 RepID=A0ABR4NXU4_9SACH
MARCAVGATVDLTGKNLETVREGLFSSPVCPVLVFDLDSSHQEFLMQNEDKSVLKVSLKLPTTLVKRPVYGFQKLIDIALDEERKATLMDLIHKSKTVVFFDNVSSFHSCLVTTYCFIDKFISYMDSSINNNSKNGSDQMYVLSSASDLENMHFMPVKTLTKKRRLSLKLKIPKRDVFVNSFKKNNDTLLYTPNSLKTYFSLEIPKIENTEKLPQWLRYYASPNDKDVILLKIYENFKLLENMETKRLERCLSFDKNSPNNQNSITENYTQDRAGSSKIYSLTHLQKQFKQKQHTGKKELRLVIPDIDVRPSPSSNSSSSMETDSDILETPLNNYEISKGIQSIHRNRYSNILPYEHTRVKLEPSPNTNVKMTFPTMKSPYKLDEDTDSYFGGGGELQGCPTISRTPKSGNHQFNDYFNASYLSLPQINPDFHYIATQAPLPSTVDDFWKVISTSKVKVIISLNSDDELDLKKWDIYWNDQTCHKFRIDITDVFEDVCGLSGCVLRVFQVRKFDKTTESMVVYQVQYKKWLDSCGIEMKDIFKLHRIKSMLTIDSERLISDLKTGTYDDNKYSSYLETNDGNYLEIVKTNPLLVHCSAGCGRTGVFITLDFLMNILSDQTSKSNKIDVWHIPQDLIFIIVNELRRQRVSMVQNLTQYIACYQSILEYFSSEEYKGAIGKAI